MTKVGRPKNFDRHAALTKAMDLFWQFGYEPTSLAQLREAMGLSSASLYNEWKSKEELFEDAVNLYLEKCGNTFRLELNSTQSALTVIKNALCDSAEIQTDCKHPYGCMILLSMINYGKDSEHIRLKISEKCRKRKENLAVVVEKAQLDGELDASISTPVLVNVIDAFMKGMALQARDGVPAETLKVSALTMLERYIL
ncbi:TetR/AcrR family transcriptional regulator [Acinetobacter tandoii]|nr:TetR/AcrR family transcriptional regulator [Acinetobacter tandoii]